MLNDIALNSIIVTIETLLYRKSIADKLISSSHGYISINNASAESLKYTKGFPSPYTLLRRLEFKPYS